MVAEDIIIKPIITEKSNMDMQEGKYTFKVEKKATKVDIKNAVEKFYRRRARRPCGVSGTRVPERTRSGGRKRVVRRRIVKRRDGKGAIIGRDYSRKIKIGFVKDKKPW